MKTRAKIYYLLAMCLAFSSQISLRADSFRRTDTGAAFSTPASDVEISFYTPTTARVVKTPAGSKWQKESLAVTASPSSTALKSAKADGNTLRLSTEGMTVSADMLTGEIKFYDGKGNLLLAENGTPKFDPMNDAGTPALTVGQKFALEPDEHIYGLGLLQNGKLSQRGINRRLSPGNVEDGIPYIHSAKNYSVYWDNYSPTQFTEKDNSFTFTSEVGDGVDYYFMRGDNADGVVAEMRALTGQVPMMPLWAYGFMQSRERYKSQDEVVGVVKKYRENGIPLDCIIQDWQYWGDNYLWNGMEFMNPDYSRPKDMIDEVHRNNARMMISIWSSFGPQTKPYRELDAKGMLFNFGTWPQSGISTQWPPRMDYPSGVRVYDAYNPEARDIYWKNLSRINEIGMDGWWMDSTEPDHLNFKPEDMDTPTHLGSFRKVRGAYPLMTVGGVYTHSREAQPDKRVCILTRSGWAGQQRYGCNVWSGDVGSSWESLRKQIPAGLNFSLTGNPNFNSDLGGFFAGAYNRNWPGKPGSENPAYRELYVRWMQMGIFTPMMRSHGTDVPREIYLYGKAGEPVYDALVDAVRLRYRLMPYIYSTAWDVTNNSSTFMRALVMDFPADSKVADMNDQYMFGRSLLAAPVTHAAYTPEDNKQISADDGWNESKGDKNLAATGEIDFTAPRKDSVYLPAGSKWYDFHTGRMNEGGQEIEIETTLASIPLYVRSGSILPIGPDVNYTTEKPWDNLEIRVYPGENGSFTLYEDDGETYGYEKGLYTEIPFKWNDKSRTLTIDKRKGSYPAMLADRKFRIVKVNGDGSTGAVKEVAYTGKKMTVKL